MAELLDKIVANATSGTGPCEECPGHESTGGWCVNPGLSNPNGEIMFVTEEPSHNINWNRHDNWAAYNKHAMGWFPDARGGKAIQKRYLDPVELDLSDVWITDSVKCRPEDKDKNRLFNTDKAFEHCKMYLADEITTVDPKAIVTLGADATKRTLRALGLSKSQAHSLQVSKDYGRCEFDTTPPVVISLHWAQRTLKRSEFIPVVQQALADILKNGESNTNRVPENDQGMMDDEKSRQVRLDSHRGRVARALSRDGWMDCYDIAEETNLGPKGASSVLSDNYRAKYVSRRENDEDDGSQYEYRLKESVEIVE